MVALLVFLLFTSGAWAYTNDCECLTQTPHSANQYCICHAPPSHDMTICVAEAAVPAHLAHGDTYLGTLDTYVPGTGCPGVQTTTTTSTTLEDVTTTSTTTTTTTCPPMPILSDPAFLAWRGGKFHIHGRLGVPPGSVVDGIGVTLSTSLDGIFLTIGCPLVLAKPFTRWACTDADATAWVKRRSDGTYAFKVEGRPSFFTPQTKLITTRVSFVCGDGVHTALWNGILGERISVRY